MRAMSVADATRMLLDDEIAAAVDSDLLDLRLASSEQHTVRVCIPTEAARAIALGYVTLMSGVTSDQELDFSGASVWLRDWNIWAETSDRVGCMLLEALRSQAGVRSPIGDAPVMWFDASEIGGTHAALALSFLFQWDSYFLPESKKFIAFASHDGFLDLMSQGETTHRFLFDRFMRGGWQPTAV